MIIRASPVSNKIHKYFNESVLGQVPSTDINKGANMARTIKGVIQTLEQEISCVNSKSRRKHKKQKQLELRLQKPVMKKKNRKKKR